MIRQGRASGTRPYRPFVEHLEPRTVPSFLPPVNYNVGSMPVAIALGDFGNRGILDLAVANRVDGTVGVLRGNSDGTFQTPRNYDAIGTLSGVAGIGSGGLVLRTEPPYSQRLGLSNEVG